MTNWARQDSNLGRRCQRVYSPSPLATWVHAPDRKRRNGRADRIELASIPVNRPNDKEEGVEGLRDQGTEGSRDGYFCLHPSAFILPPSAFILPALVAERIGERAATPKPVRARGRMKRGSPAGGDGSSDLRTPGRLPLNVTPSTGCERARFTEPLASART